MKKLLIISFDLIREGEPQTSLAIGSILAYLKKNQGYGEKFEVEHLSVNMTKYSSQTRVDDLKILFDHVNFDDYDFIALSAYIWNEFLTNDVMVFIRLKYCFKGEFVLGGYQISYSNNPAKEYPDCSYFINGYAEKSLLDILTKNSISGLVSSSVDFNNIPSPYLTNEIEINANQKMVRLETKRGCPYRCSFCAHRDLKQNKVHKHELNKVFEELHLFKEKNVQKINIIDPIFNVGTDYIKVLQEMDRINLSSEINIQGRFEMIKEEKGDLFLDLSAQLNLTVEFGLQTAITSESKLINRKNDPSEIKKVMKKLNDRGIDFEISLIYGLPHQTLVSFQQSIDFALENGCKRLTAFPLMLLKGTELYQQKEQFNFIEAPYGEYNIPVVIKSSSYSESDWSRMRQIADGLMKNERI